MHALRPRLYWLAGIAVCCLLVGCGVQSNVNGDVHSYSHDPKGIAAAIIGGIALTVGGWYVAPYSRQLRFAMMLAGIVIALLIAPAILFEKGTVSKDAFTYQGGFLGTSGASVKLDDLNAISIETTIHTRNGKDSYSDEIVCINNDGTEASFYFNNAVQQAACFDFLRNAKARGIIIDKKGWVAHPKNEPWP
ncbi:hypothetical protein LOC68_13445 [Blastopirellula sp. JC732]|uniref:Lipoprotein n=1 Tax=Blastopirellula sediminis TaxID=2894196 RepID=A0A9X1SK62_9BACT|nr:hypothetical protein [Blastopirellula sediminis]MCC9607308.1 hypothetical protein [Blastopirellula sediminis]MCC9629399.1 hypothetical protein [Blastopirellula sediminis]